MPGEALTPEWFVIVRILHIVAGAMGLFVGPLAMATAKGKTWHRRWGKGYVSAMAVVGATAVAMSLHKSNSFLLAVAVFSFYLSFSGWRTLGRKGGPKAKPGLPLPDLLISLFGVVAGGWLFWQGAASVLGGNGFGSVLTIFGSLAIGLSSAELRQLWQVPAPGKWMGQHIGRMLGAYTATLTAFSAVNFHFVPPLVAWLWPTALMLPLIGLTIRRHRKLRGGGKEQEMSAPVAVASPLNP